MDSTLTQDNILSGLNPVQTEVVTHGAGPQLVVAGAGTGKTAVITRRIAYLVASKACLAREILALTFTDKAAEEMESRVDVLVPYGFTDSTVCTFHAFGDRLLREQGMLLGLNPDYRVLTQTEQMVFLRERLFELPLERLRPLSDPTRHLQFLISVISRAKDEDVGSSQYLDYCERLRPRAEQGGDEAFQAEWEKQLEIARVYAKYQELMTAAGLADFGDLITRSLELLRTHPDVLQECRRRYRYILVDEFQDTNAAQFELVKLLAGDEANLTVVGDDDQSIYKFRGAAVSNILQFTNQYPQSKIRVLTENYRSTQPILDCAYRLIQHNNPERLEIRHHLDKRLHSSRKEGESVFYRSFDTISSEADWIAADIARRLTEENRGESDFAVLVRANRHADPFIRALNVKGVPYRFSGSHGLYRRPEVRVCLAFLRTIADPSASLAVHELASSELYAFPAEDLAALASAGRRKHLSLFVVLQNALAGEGPCLTEAGISAGRRLADDVRTYLDASRRTPTGQLLYRFLTESGLLNRYAEADSPESDFAIKNIAKFFSVIQRYERIAKSDRVLHFIQHLDMLEDAGDDPSPAEVDGDAKAVSILTLHRAKGLEFPVVYMVGMAANRFPPVHRRPTLDLPSDLAKEEIPDTDSFLPEERRLCYVGMTRAKQTLIFTSAKDYGGARTYKTSRFVLEALELPKPDTRTLTVSALESIRAHAPLPGMKPAESSAMDPEQPLNLSYYQIQDFLNCPLRYKYTHILQIPFLPHHSVLFGNALHAAVQAYYLRRLKQGTLMTEEEVIEVFKNAWINEGFISREHEEMRLEAGLKAIHNMLAKEILTPSNTINVEMAFSYTLGPNKINGRMDRVDRLSDGGTVIIDFKSSEVYDQEEADKKAAESLQMKIYASAWQHLQGVPPSRLELHFLETGLVGRAVFDSAVIEKTDKQILEIAGEIRKQEFPPKPSSWTCGYCPYRSICPHKSI